MDDLLAEMLERLQHVDGRWTVESTATSIEVRPQAFEERKRRCTIKLYVTERARLGVFFYKRSLLPYSRNRYSYGHIVVNGAIDDEQVRGWLRFAEAGFHPDSRPPRLRRAAPDTLPD